MAVTEEILINVTPQETRVAVIEQGVTQEVHVERASARGVCVPSESRHATVRLTRLFRATSRRNSELMEGITRCEEAA